MSRIWNPPDPDNFVERYRTGTSAKQLADEFGVAHKTVAAALTRRGVVLRGHGLQPVPDTLVAAYEGGESILSMSRRLGISRTSLTNRLRAAGVQLRGVSANGRNSVTAQARAALTRELSQVSAAPSESPLLQALRERGLSPAPQRAVGPYNIDIAVVPVAVEVLGSDWHNAPAKRKAMRERTEYLLGQGWNVIYVIQRRGSTLVRREVTDEVVAFVERSRREPSFMGEYRVLGSNGKESAAFGLSLHE